MRQNQKPQSQAGEIMTKATKATPPTRSEMDKATEELKRRAIIEGIDACHLCFKPYQDYEHTYHGVTHEGIAVVVCGAFGANYLRYGIGFGIYTPSDDTGFPTDSDPYKAAFYSHPWNKPGNLKGTH